VIKSPREKFQSSQIRTGQWSQLVANPIFDEACDSALLQLLQTLPSDGAFEIQKPYSSHMQMVGAQNLIRILKTLHETTQEPKKTTQQGLNYNEGV